MTDAAAGISVTAQRKSLGDKTCHLDVFSLLLYADMYTSVSSSGM